GPRVAARARAARRRGRRDGECGEARGARVVVSAGSPRSARGIVAVAARRRPRRGVRQGCRRSASGGRRGVVKPLVVLLHGLARGHGSMAKLSTHLRKHGFDTWSTTY